MVSLFTELSLFLNSSFILEIFCLSFKFDFALNAVNYGEGGVYEVIVFVCHSDRFKKNKYQQHSWCGRNCGASNMDQTYDKHLTSV